MLTGRKNEIKILTDILKKDESQFVAIYGRRRIGKTYLVKEVYKDKLTFQYTGILNVRNKEQLKNFNNSLKEYGFTYNEPINDWLDAFSALKGFIKTKDSSKKIIFLDELSWIDTPKSGFIQALESFWNGWAYYRNDIILIVCASSASWMLKKVIHNRGGLYNRLNYQINLGPFSLKECKDYLNNNHINLDEYNIIKLYMVFGGIPYYWSLIRNGESSSLVINRLLFEENCELKNEFNYLYQSIFKDYESYLKIINSLITKKIGLTREEICSYSKLANNGELTKKLYDLEACGFIRKYYKYGSKNKDSIYQLIDNYTLFYYKFLKEKSYDTNYWINNIDTPLIHNWEGLSFEIVALEHIKEIKAALGISGVSTNVLSYHVKSDLDNGIFGSQIDLLLDRKDQIVNICEAKFSNKEYVIDKDTSFNIKHKVSDFKNTSKTKSAINVVLITTYGLIENSYSSDIVKVITLEDFFK